MAIHYLTDNSSLVELSSTLHNISEFSIDLEFDRNRYRYGFNLCLMQIYDGNDCYLIDPLLKNLDINLIFPPIENNEILKVVFAFGEDLRLLHSLGCFPKNLYDLDVATSLLNYKPTSLTNLIEEVLSIEVNSSSQDSNWYKRPLTEDQKHYAADDVLYLLDFKKALEVEAKKHGLSDWIKQENETFNHLDYSDEDHNNLIKQKDMKDMSKFEWHIYKKMMRFFDEVARSYNKPVYHLVSKKVLTAIAQDPDRVDQWNSERGIFGKLKNDSFQKKLSNVVREAISEAERTGLSSTQKASQTMSSDEYREMRQQQSRISALKTKLMQPIQDKIAEDFGSHAKSFILPNRLAKEIIAGEAELVPDYKVNLLRRYANEMDLDLSRYI
ncbi:MAG: hypothetical protein RI564_03205 [Gracilimonas sp.]|jgi:ribonuclease D|nr:hypothetical protein [Gracilimonas sp.]